MTSILKYRPIAFTLAFVFAIFNIGLPIVVASCPMVKYANANKCFLCTDGTAATSVRFTNWIDKSCCETKYAAERNTTEFLQAIKVLSLSNFLFDIPSIIPSAQPAALTSLKYQHVGPSPPRSIDIPILVASLLI